jgi:hypothetical protein
MYKRIIPGELHLPPSYKDYDVPTLFFGKRVYLEYWSGENIGAG